MEGSKFEDFAIYDEMNFDFMIQACGFWYRGDIFLLKRPHKAVTINMNCLQQKKKVI